MRIGTLTALGVLSALALPARAAEFVPGWTVETIWDSNVLRTSEDETADYSVRTGPNIRFREQQGDLQYDLSYRPRYEAFLETEGINEFDQFLEAEGSWDIDSANQIQIFNSFAYTSSLAGLFESQGFGPDAVTVVVPARERITVNTGSGNFVHRFGPLWQVSAQFSSQLYEYEERLEPDSLANGATVQLTRNLSPRLLAGFGAQIQRQDFDAVSAQDESHGTTFYQGFGTFSYSISRTWTIAANAGPAWSVPDSPPSETTVLNYVAVNPSTCKKNAQGVPFFNISGPNNIIEAGGCQRAFYRNSAGAVLVQPVVDSSGRPIGVAPLSVTPGGNDAPARATLLAPFDGDVAEGALSYFGRLSIQKTWQHWNASLALERNASTSSGVGGSTILTALTGRLQWTPARQWTIDFEGVYTTQTSANDVREQLWLLDTDSSLIPNTTFNGVTGFPDPVGVPFQAFSGDEIDNAIDIVTWRIELNAERRFGRNLRVFGRASYWHQDSQGDLRVEQSQDVTRVLIGVDWTFDPIPL